MLTFAAFPEYGRLGARLHRTADASAHHGAEATLPATRPADGRRRAVSSAFVPAAWSRTHPIPGMEMEGNSRSKSPASNGAIPLRPSLAATRLWPVRSSIVSCTALSSLTIRVFAKWLLQGSEIVTTVSCRILENARRCSQFLAGGSVRLRSDMSKAYAWFAANNIACFRALNLIPAVSAERSRGAR